MLRRVLACAAALLAAACSLDGVWQLVESGYSIDLAPSGGEFVFPYTGEFAFRVHVNELRQRGGDIKSPQFHLFVTERLQRHGLCPGGWEEQLCSDPALCVHRTAYSVTILGRCLP